MGRNAKITPEDEKLLVQLYDPGPTAIGLTLAELADKFDVSTETIRRALQRHNYIPNKKHRLR
jgi:transcriptional antiterminator